LLDEPFAGLFPEMRKIVASIIRELREEEKTVVLIEHNIDLIRELCDYIIALDSGRLLAEGEPIVVLENKKVVEAYLGK
ncbi:MAG: ABC transporter ATP-binding protein, partial [Patescibacteria group bacterium]